MGLSLDSASSFLHRLFSNHDYIRLSAFGARITSLEGQGLVLLLGKSTKKMKYPKQPTETTSGESMNPRIPMTFITLTDTTLTKPTGCVTSMQLFLSRVKTWLLVKWAPTSTSTPSNTSCPIKSYLFGTARSLP